jgi:hypothetical protein
LFAKIRSEIEPSLGAFRFSESREQKGTERFIATFQRTKEFGTVYRNDSDELIGVS